MNKGDKIVVQIARIIASYGPDHLRRENAGRYWYSRATRVSLSDGKLGVTYSGLPPSILIRHRTAACPFTVGSLLILEYEGKDADKDVVFKVVSK